MHTVIPRPGSVVTTGRSFELSADTQIFVQPNAPGSDANRRLPCRGPAARHGFCAAGDGGQDRRGAPSISPRWAPTRPWAQRATADRHAAVGSVGGPPPGWPVLRRQTIRQLLPLPSNARHCSRDRGRYPPASSATCRASPARRHARRGTSFLSGGGRQTLHRSARLL